MASQISHIVYAKTFFDRMEQGKMPNGTGKIDKDEFFLGCVFPDIRLIDDMIKRKDTHCKFPILDLDFSGLTSFEAGWKFHLYCDMRREEVLSKYKFYSLEKTSDFVARPAKFLEDEILYDKYNNWEKLAHYFNNPPFFDVGFDVDRETFNLWYAILARYVGTKPDIKSMRVFLSKIILSHKEGVVDTILMIEKDKRAVEILGKVWEEIV
jgi:hypothetical protein